MMVFFIKKKLLLKIAARFLSPDYCQVVSLVDPTVVDPTMPGEYTKVLKCNLFRSEVKDLPLIQRVGDIVRLHRIKVSV